MRLGPTVQLSSSGESNLQSKLARKAVYVSRLSEEELESDDVEPRREIRFIPQNARGEEIIQAL